MSSRPKDSDTRGSDADLTERQVSEEACLGPGFQMPGVAPHSHLGASCRHLARARLAFTNKIHICLIYTINRAHSRNLLSSDK